MGGSCGRRGSRRTSLAQTVIAGDSAHTSGRAHHAARYGLSTSGESLGHRESNARREGQEDTGQPDTPGHTIVDMESWQRPIAEQLAELDSLDLTPVERALAEGYILEGPEAVEWTEAALAVMPPIDIGGYPEELLDSFRPMDS